MKYIGEITFVKYRNDENSFIIATMDVQDPKQMNNITIKGNTPINIMTGMKVEIDGCSWNKHLKYGNQVSFKSLVPILPTKTFEIEKYLASGIITGIGPDIASKIVNMFGEKTFDVFDNRIEDLKKVSGIADKRLQMIKGAWILNKKSQELVLFLQKHDISTNLALKLYKVYGENSMRVVKNNPYQLVRDVQGVGFSTADKIAMSIGISPESPERANAAIFHILQTGNNIGHCYLPKDVLFKQIDKLTSMKNQTIIESLAKVIEENYVAIPKEYDDRVYLKTMLSAELGIVKNLERIHCSSSKFFTDVDPSQYSKLSLTNMQNEAIQSVFKKNVSVITGGPGTGKTTIINTIINICEDNKLTVELAAPTGKAAKRMSEVTGMEARTIHRLLEYSPVDHIFLRNESRPLNCDIVIIDEASMIDTVLFYCLVKAIPNNCKLILVGDVDQLPSVGAGNVLGDIISTPWIHTTKLNTIFRQSEQSYIIVNSHRINNGDFPIIKEGNDDFVYFKENDPERIKNIVLKSVCEILPKKYGYNPLMDIQVLIPKYKGDVGINVLNEILQKKLNSNYDRDYIQIGFRRFAVGDKVMATRNDYDKEVFNGDVGIIKNINKEDGIIQIRIDERNIEYTRSEMDDIILAYATSVHRSQGSQYKAIVMPIVKEYGNMLLQRNLVYTGITRAKNHVILIGEEEALQYAIQNNHANKRYTGLIDFLNKNKEK